MTDRLKEALHAVDDQGSDFVVRPIRWPWNVLIDNARLVADAIEPDYEAAAERLDDLDFSVMTLRGIARAAVDAALGVEPGTRIKIVVMKVVE